MPPAGGRRSLRSLELTAMLCPLLLLAACAVASDTVILAPSKDTTIYDEGAKSNGAGDHVFAGTTSGGARRRALVGFDTTAVPPGARVTAVELRLELTQTSTGTHTVSLQRLLADWGEGASNAILMEGSGAPAEEGDATWMERFFPDTDWATDGGDFAAASASLAAGGLGTYTVASTPDLVADVQGWVDAPATSFGWLLRGTETGTKSAKRFDSRHLPATAPRLTIAFDPPPSLAATASTLPLGAGGTWTMSLFEDPAKAGQLYWILGSATGTSPGLPFPGGVVVPLNPDPYLRLTLTKPFLGAFGAFVGLLDASGRATPSLTLPPGTDPDLAGIPLFHAATIAATPGTVDGVSNAVAVTLVP